MKHTRKVPIVVLAAAALTLTACAQSDRDSGNTASSGTAREREGHVHLRCCRRPQAVRPLLRHRRRDLPGHPPDALAASSGSRRAPPTSSPTWPTSWEPSADGLSWTFKLTQGVKFSDGTEFNAEAVCYNMDRMFNQKGAGQTAAEYWGYFFGALQRQAGDLAVQVAARSRTRRPRSSTSPGRPRASRRSCRSTRSRCSRPPRSRPVTPTTSSPQGEGFKLPGLRQGPGRHRPVQARQVRRGQQDRHPRGATTSTAARSRRPAKIVFKIIPDESTRRQELQAGSHRRLRPAEPGGLEGSEGRRQPGRRAPGVQHPLHGPERRRRTRS